MKRDVACARMTTVVFTREEIEALLKDHSDLPRGGPPELEWVFVSGEVASVKLCVAERIADPGGYLGPGDS